MCPGSPGIRQQPILKKIITNNFLAKLNRFHFIFTHKKSQPVFEL